MATITAQQIQDAQKQGVLEVVTALRVVHATVEAMRESDLEGFKLWLGGLPQDLQNAGGQTFYMAQQIAEKFGLPFEQPQASE